MYTVQLDSAERHRYPGRGANGKWFPIRREAEYDAPPYALGNNPAGESPTAIASALNRIREIRSAEVSKFYRDNLSHLSDCVFTWSIRRKYIEALDIQLRGIGVLQKINNSRWVNKYFRAINERLHMGGIFVGCAEVIRQRKLRICGKLPWGLATPYCALDFVLHRMWPKVPVLKKIYFAATRGRNRPMAEPEFLGRLLSCGFEFIDSKEIGGLMYFAVRKISLARPVESPTYGPFCALNRVGRGGEVIRVFKLRTMHPYSEFLQEYVFEKGNLQDGGKFKDDFRITCWGRWLRRFWIDEIPMLLNLLNGNMKFVGVRPISYHYYSLYPVELQELRKKHTPGLLPPFYADLPRTFEEIVASEMKYLRSYEKSPFATDVRYFCAAVRNILVRRARSA